VGVDHVSKDERRLYVRARVAATATAWVRGLCKGSYLVENLSLGGAYMSGGPAVRAGEELKVVLQLPRGPVEIRGVVLRSGALARDWSLAVRFERSSRQAGEAIGVAVAEALEEARRGASSRAEPTVLVVDDSLLVREALTRDIRCVGSEAACFSTSLDALDFIDRPESRIEVALIDLAGARGGRDLFIFLADEKPAIRRVLMADQSRRPSGDLVSLAARADALLAKPWDQETLARTIKRASL
jgi:hypothetical protein